MKHIQEIIQDYLDNDHRETAIMINGEWGSGKTFYMKNVVMKRVKNYKPYYISLNGVYKLEDISDKVLLSVLAKNGEGSWGLFSSSLKFATEVNLGNEVKLFQDLAKAMKGIASYSALRTKLHKAVLIIDDLERVSSKLDTVDVLGYICCNYLEGTKTKIIFISNEPKIASGEGYKTVREKTISKVIEFKPEIADVLDTFIANEIYQNNELFMEFFQENKNLVLEILNHAEIKNLRTVQSILDKFYKTCIHVPASCSPWSLKRIFRFIAAVQNEYDLGTLPTDEIKLNEEMSLFEKSSFAGLRGSANDASSQKEYIDGLIAKYFGRNHHSFVMYKSLFTYIVTHYFDPNRFNKEYVEFNPATNEAVVALDRFHGIYSYETEDEVQSALSDLVIHIKSEQYNIHDLYSIYANNRHLHDAGIDTQNVVEIEKLVIEKCIKLIESISESNELTSLYREITHSEMNKSFKESIEQVYNAKREELIQSSLHSLTVGFFEQHNKGYGDYALMRMQQDNWQIFVRVVEMKLLDSFKTLTSSGLMNLRSYVESLYSLSNLKNEKAEKEILCVEKIISYLKDNLSTDSWKKNIQSMLIQAMEEAIKPLRKPDPS